MTEETHSYITEEILRQRLKKVDAGLKCPQIFVTFTVCLGSIIFGNILGWGAPLKYDLPSLIYEDKQKDFDDEFVWIICLAPIAAVARTMIAFLNIFKVGPKKAMIYQAPFLIASFVVMAFVCQYKWYYTAQFFNGFFSFGYIYLGEKLLTATVHRKYLKVSYTFFRGSIFLGVLLMNMFGSMMTKSERCCYNVSLVIACSGFLFFLPESPVHLMNSNEDAARNALYFFRGKHTREFDTIKNYVQLKNSNNFNFKILLRRRVIYKALLICMLIELLSVCSGYYAFILDSSNMLTEERSVISPYYDIVIYSVVLVIGHMVSKFVYLNVVVPVRPLLIASSCAVNLILLSMATYDYEVCYVLKIPYKSWMMLLFLCSVTMVYELGLSSCSDTIVYNYIPFQIYEESRQLMFFVRWLFIALLVRLYPLMKLWFGLFAVLLVLAFIEFVCLVLCCIFVVEVKGKSLLQVQMALGGNPVGNRGSRRQRIGNPFEQVTGPTVLEIINYTASAEPAADQLCELEADEQAPA